MAGAAALLATWGTASCSTARPLLPDGTFEESYDLVVVGAGAAGMSCALAAREAGVERVAILDKAPQPGGNSALTTSGINAAGTVYQQAQGIDDSPEAFAQETLAGGHNLADPDVVAAMCAASSDAVDWLDQLGLTLDNVVDAGGMSVPRSHRPTNGSALGASLMPVLQNALEQQGVQVVGDSHVAELIVEDGSVRGVRTTEDGVSGVYHAQAVVLACGGMCAGGDMLARFRPDVVRYLTTNKPQATGDGFAMAEEAGAALVNMEYVQVHPTVHYAQPVEQDDEEDGEQASSAGPGATPNTEGESSEQAADVNAPSAPDSDQQENGQAPATAEDASSASPDDASANAKDKSDEAADGASSDASSDDQAEDNADTEEEIQPDPDNPYGIDNVYLVRMNRHQPGPAAIIAQALRANGAILVNAQGNRFFDEMAPNDTLTAAIADQPDGYAWLVFDQAIYDANRAVANQYDPQGMVVAGESWEALALQMGVDAQALQAAYEQYHAVAASGALDMFGRTQGCTTFAPGPRYAIRVAPGIHYGMGGVSINAHGQVLDAQGQPIDGLWAAGEVTGSVHGTHRISGNGICDAITFGRSIGLNALQALSPSS